MSALRQLGGVASAGQLVALGVKHRALSKAVQHGRVRRVRRGTYVLPGTSYLHELQHAWHVVPTCVTALRHFELPQQHAARGAHVAVSRSQSTGRGHRPLPPGTHPHYFTRVPELSVIDAIDTSSRCLSPLRQLVAIDAALNRELLARGALDTFCYTEGRRLDWLRRYCDSGAQSPPETLARLALVRAGLRVSTQVFLPGVGRVDMVVNDALIVEVDGQTYHMDERSFQGDRDRDRVALAEWGLRTMRFTRYDVELRREMMVQQVVAALRRHHARPL